MMENYISQKPGEELKKHSTRNWLKSVGLTMPIAFILWFSLLDKHLNSIDVIFFAGLISFLFFVTLFFLMQHTGKTYRYRRILFITMAVCIFIGLINEMVEAGGLMTSSMEDALLLNHNFCPLALPMTIIPAAINKVIIFPGSLIEGHASFAFLVTLWVGSSLAIGRGFCSWLCFFGGFDEGFSSMTKKPKLVINKIWTLLPYAVLITMILVSAKTLTPFFCQWLCPWKTVTRIASIGSFYVLLTTLASMSLFAVLVIALPILTGKRTQCSIFCPFAASQSLTNKLNIFDVRIDKEKCNNCLSCIRHCPTLSIDSESLKKGKTLMTCTKCGRCIDICKNQAIFYHIKGTPIGIRTNLARNAFLYSAFIFGSVIGSGMLAKAKINVSGFFTM